MRLFLLKLLLLILQILLSFNLLKILVTNHDKLIIQVYLFLVKVFDSSIWTTAGVFVLLQHQFTDLKSSLLVLEFAHS